MPPFLLKPKVGKHLNTITLNLTESMVDHYPIKKNRSKQILDAMRSYLDTFSDDKFTGVDNLKIVTISKPGEALYDKIYKAVKSGLSISRAELFREAIRWDMQRLSKENREQLKDDSKDGVVRVPNGDKEPETIYNVIGIA